MAAAFNAFKMLFWNSKLLHVVVANGNIRTSAQVVGSLLKLLKSQWEFFVSQIFLIFLWNKKLACL